MLCFFAAATPTMLVRHLGPSKAHKQLFTLAVCCMRIVNLCWLDPDGTSDFNQIIRVIKLKKMMKHNQCQTDVY